MKLIIGLIFSFFIFGIIIFLVLKIIKKKEQGSSAISVTATYTLIILTTLSFISILDFTIRAFEIFKGDLFVQRYPSEIVKNIYVKKYRSDGNIHPFLLYTSTPNFNGVLPLIEPNKEYKISINSHGFRTKEFYPKLPWKVRIVIMGDSFMWGYNANQDETTAAVLESIIHKKISKDVEVLSLGVPSYSNVRYAALSRIYLDYLNPDIVIVAIDQSDYIDDSNYIHSSYFDDYILDDKGYPYVLKNADELLEKKESAFLALDEWGNMTKEKLAFNLKNRMQIGSPLAETILSISDRVMGKSKLYSDYKNENGKTTANNFSQRYPDINIITYKELVTKFGNDISKGLPMYVARDIIPFTLDRAIKEYQDSYKSLEYILNETSKRNQALYLSTYPYPMMITPFENIDYHVNYHRKNSIFDFSENRVHPELTEYFANKLGVKHINTYKEFEKNFYGMWGNVDPHLSPKGYNLFANSLFEGIKDEIKIRLKSSIKKRPSNIQ